MATIRAYADLGINPDRRHRPSSSGVDPGGSMGVEGSVGSGGLGGGFNGESKATALQVGPYSTSVSTNAGFASIGVGLSTPTIVDLGTERGNTVPISSPVSGNIYQEAAQAVRRVGESINAMLHVGDAAAAAAIP